MNKIVTPHSHNREIMKNTEPALCYDGAKPFARWQNEAREKLTELLGLAKFARCEQLFDVEWEHETETMTETRFTFQSEEGYFVPCHFCVPKGASGPLPLVICVQGHSKGMHVSFGRTHFPGEDPNAGEGDRQFALQIIENGYCALAIEQRNFGECGGTPDGPDCYNSAMSALLLGRTTAAERVWDVMRAIDVITEHFPQADSKKIALMGNSGGGTTTFYTACLDERIVLAMPSCAVCTYDASIAAMRHCACNFVPRIREYFNMGDLAGLVAPRKLIVVAGKEDRIFPLHGVLESYETVKKMYEAAGATGNCRLVLGEGGHRFYAAQSWPVFHGLFD
ncbi:MAG: alpha/beta hydrolase family protein [Oscillospiraceae bacterium]|jgi:dienelactone hydrolase|nr:alpha/beta hydrolase family protein [Oscillospiraceae bacterium]